MNACDNVEATGGIIEQLFPPLHYRYFYKWLSTSMLKFCTCGSFLVSLYVDIDNTGAMDKVPGMILILENVVEVCFCISRKYLALYR